MNICDSLAHVTEDGKWYHTNHDASIDRLLKEMDKANVKYAAITALPDYISNETVMKYHRKHPDRLIPVAILEPKKIKSVNTYKYLLSLRESGFKSIKIHPRFSCTDPLSPELHDFYSFCQEYGLVVYLCTHFKSRTFQTSKSPSETAQALTEQYPSLILVLLHGGLLDLPNLVNIVREKQNIYIDISYTLCRYSNEPDIIKSIRELSQKYSKKIIWGSDFPEYTQYESINILKNLTNGIAIEKLNDIVSHNFHHIHGLNL